MAINKPKNRGIKSVWPKYMITAVISASSEYFKIEPEELCIAILFFRVYSMEQVSGH
jgi:hypothetical protein